MRATIISPTTLTGATAAAVLLLSLVSSRAVTAFHTTTATISSYSPMMANAAAAATAVRLSTQLEAAASSSSSSNNNFSELDKLRAKRMSLRPSSAAAVPSISSNAAANAAAAAAVPLEKKQGLEYLYDKSEERHADDFFHVILMPSTFAKKQMSIEQATESILSTLSTTSATPNLLTTYEKVRDASLFAKHQGFALLGTWTRTECLVIGEELSKLDLDCRVIPYSEEIGLSSSSLMTTTSSSPSSFLEESVGSSSSSSNYSRKSNIVVGRSSSSSVASSSSDYLLSLTR